MRSERLAGGHRIASFLRSQGWDVEVVDWAPYWTIEQLQEFVKSRVTSNTKFFGFSSFFQHWDDNTDVFVKWLKTSYPNIAILAGGPRLPKSLSKHVDYYVYGYAEYALLEIIKHISGTSTQTLKYDLKYADYKVVAADIMYPAAPMPDAAIIYEHRDFIEPYEWLTIEFARGCKFKCSFCNYSFLGVKEDFTRSASSVENQLQDAYEKFGVTSYTVVDETFNDTTDKILKFANVVQALPFKPMFNGFIRADLLVSRPQDWEHLANMHFFGHFYGIESMNHKTAQSVGKGMNPDKLLAGVLEAKKYFETHGINRYRGTISLIIGLPYENKESLDKSFAWLVNNWQGQNVQFYPLLIEREGNARLTTDWPKFGYKEVDKQLGTYQNFPPRPEYFENNLCWENEFMDLPTAYAITDQFITDARDNYDFRPAAVHLGRVEKYFPKAELFNVSTKEFTEVSKDTSIEDVMIQDYITKKLNWR